MDDSTLEQQQCNNNNRIVLVVNTPSSYSFEARHSMCKGERSHCCWLWKSPDFAGNGHAGEQSLVRNLSSCRASQAFVILGGGSSVPGLVSNGITRISIRTPLVALQQQKKSPTLQENLNTGEKVHLAISASQGFVVVGGGSSVLGLIQVESQQFQSETSLFLVSLSGQVHCLATSSAVQLDS